MPPMRSNKPVLGPSIIELLRRQASSSTAEGSPPPRPAQAPDDGPSTSAKGKGKMTYPEDELHVAKHRKASRSYLTKLTSQATSPFAPIHELNHASSSRLPVPPIAGASRQSTAVSAPVSAGSTSAPLRPFSTTLNAEMQRAKYKRKIDADGATARPYPVDGGISGDDAIGHQLINIVKQKAFGNKRDADELWDEPGGFVEFLRRLRVRENLVDFADDDLSIASQVAVDLFEIARQPLRLNPELLPSFHFAGRVQDLESNKRESPPSAGWSLYIRSRRFNNPRLLEAEARVYMKDFFADADFATLVISRAQALSASPDNDSAVWLLYGGQTTANTPLGRCANDLEICPPVHFGDWQKAAKRAGLRDGNGAWEVFARPFAVTDKTDDVFAASRELQAAEFALVACMSPWALNSAPGEFHHEPRLPQRPRPILVPTPTFAHENDIDSANMRQTLRRVHDDMA